MKTLIKPLRKPLFTPLLLSALCTVALASCSSTSPTTETADSVGLTDSSSDATAGNTTAGTTAGGSTGGNTAGGTTSSTTGTSTAGDQLANSATYRLRFDSTWSAGTHPLNFPSNPHFSGLVGAVHNNQIIFWENGQIATTGIEQMAETGSKSLFKPEINAAISDGKALSLIDGGGIASSPGTTSIEFTVTRAYPQLTAVTMLAPSPDWFAGVHNLNLIGSDQKFVDSVSVALELYDAGTDSGVSYTSGNIDTTPNSTIALIATDTAAHSFTDGNRIVGSFVIEKIQ